MANASSQPKRKRGSFAFYSVGYVFLFTRGITRTGGVLYNILLPDSSVSSVTNFILYRTYPYITKNVQALLSRYLFLMLNLTSEILSTYIAFKYNSLEGVERGVR